VPANFPCPRHDEVLEISGSSRSQSAREVLHTARQIQSTMISGVLTPNETRYGFAPWTVASGRADEVVVDQSKDF